MEVLHPGANTLEITVINTFANRLIGDMNLPADQRITWSFHKPYTADSTLTESGLIGPVTLKTVWRNTVR